MVIFYHTDDDGKCAGYWAGKLNKRKTGVCDHVTKYVPINYGNAIPWDQIANDELVYIVDFSFEPKDMDQLLSITKNVIWIDHHISAINKYKDYPHKIDGIRLDGVAGCLLTYAYLKSMVTINGDQATSVDSLIENVIAPPYSDEVQSDLTEALLIRNCAVPGFTKLIADWDIWKFKYANTKNFHTGFSTISHDPESDIWDKLNSDTDEARELFDSIILKGRSLIDYRQNWMRNYCKSLGFDAVFIGKGDVGRYKCFALNSGMLSSDDFFVPEDKKDLYDVFVGFAFDGDKYRYSLRAAHEDVDVSAIAQYFGGGGHKGAAGFTSDHLVLMKAY